MISPEYFRWLERYEPSPTEFPEYVEFKNLSTQEKLKLLKTLAYAIGQEEVTRLKTEIDTLREKKKRLEQEEARIREKIKRIDKEIRELQKKLDKVKVNKKSLTIYL